MAPFEGVDNKACVAQALTARLVFGPFLGTATWATATPEVVPTKHEVAVSLWGRPLGPQSPTYGVHKRPENVTGQLASLSQRPLGGSLPRGDLVHRVMSQETTYAAGNLPRHLSPI